MYAVKNVLLQTKLRYYLVASFLSVSHIVFLTSVY